MLSPEEYVKRGGRACPNCSSRNMDGVGSYEEQTVPLEPFAVVSDVICRDCGSMWTDVYKLAGYDNFEKDARNRLNGESKGHLEKE